MRSASRRCPINRCTFSRLVCVLGLAVLPAACQQQMAVPPYYRPLQPSSFFKDQRSARPLVNGVVTRGQPVAGSPLVSGLVPGTDPLADPLKSKDFVTAFPFEVTEADLLRGQERFGIYCAPCHGITGHGHGKVVERGYLRPPSYHTDLSRAFAIRGEKVLLRDVPVGYFYEVISQGFGGMPEYSVELTPVDRWRVAAYVRTLQLSQYTPLEKLPEEQQRAAREALKGVQP